MSEENQAQTVPLHPVLPGFQAPPRPNTNDMYVMTRATEMLLPKMMKWVEQDGNYHHKDDVKESLLEHIFPSRNRDGFELAKHLEKHAGYDGDSELVEILDDAAYMESQALEELTRQWVQVYGITIPFAVGDRVMVPDFHKHRKDIGVVNGLHPETAKCVVRFDGLTAFGGYVFDFERVKKADEVTV